MSYLPSPCRSNFLKYFSSSVRIHEPVFMNLFLKNLRSSVKFWQRRKRWVVYSDSKLQEHSGFMNKTLF